MPENYIDIRSEKGSVNISEEVIASIASAAIAEVEGVTGFANTVGTEIYELLGKKPANKGVRVAFEDGVVVIDIVVMIRYGCGIAKVASRAQSAVISEVESMTGLTPRVNIHVTGVAFDK